MRRVPLPLRFGTLLLGSALVFACAHRTRECTTCSSCNLDRQYLRPSAAAKCDSCTKPTPCTTATQPCAKCPTPCSTGTTTTKPGLVPTTPVVQPVPPSPKPSVTTDTKIPRVTILSVEARETPPVAKPASPKPTTIADNKIPRVTIVSVEGSLPATEPFAVPNPRSEKATPPAPPAPPAPSRRENPQSLSLNGDSRSQPASNEDQPAHPLSTHAPDYSWLVGELRYIPERNVWTVRFTSEEEKIDTVTLIAPGPLTGMTSGQLVRVEGQLVAASPVEPHPGYQTRSVSLVSAH